jgi:hypothetical protein
MSAVPCADRETSSVDERIVYYPRSGTLRIFESVVVDHSKDHPMAVAR